MRTTGIILMVAGAAILAAGLLLFVAAKIPFLGNLPGDMRFRIKGAHFYFPLTTCILVSIVLTLLLNLILRCIKR